MRHPYRRLCSAGNLAVHVATGSMVSCHVSYPLQDPRFFSSPCLHPVRLASQASDLPFKRSKDLLSDTSAVPAAYPDGIAIDPLGTFCCSPSCV